MTFYTTWMPADDQMLLDLWDKGVPSAAIGRALSRTKNSVIGRAHRLNCKARPAMGPAATIPEEKAAKIRLFLSNGMSAYSAAMRVGVDPKTARRIRDMNGPVRRSDTERVPSLFDDPIYSPEPSRVLPNFWVAPVKKYVPTNPKACCWLDGERHNFIRCTAPSVSGTSWCCEHRAIVFSRKVAA